MRESGSLMYREIGEQPHVLERGIETHRIIWKEIVSDLKKRPMESIQLVARGTSDHVAIFTKYIGEYYLGIPVSLMASSIINLYKRPLNLFNSLTVGISQSGSAPDAIGVLREAKRQGGLTLAITNEEGSPITREATYSLFCQAGKEKSVAATKTCTASMMLLGGLIGEWAKDSSLLEELVKVPTTLEKILSKKREIERLARRFKEAKECLVLGRGFNYAAALETALKIKETSYIYAGSYSTADFLHGPIAIVNQRVPVLIFAFKGPLLAGIEETIYRLKEMQIEVLIVTDAPSLRDMDDTLYVPHDLKEEVTPFISIVIGQLFSYYLAISRGHDPDLPRYLKKVTKTL